jgi:hypothetical protein
MNIGMEGDGDKNVWDCEGEGGGVCVKLKGGVVLGGLGWVLR